MLDLITNSYTNLMYNGSLSIKIIIKVYYKVRTSVSMLEISISKSMIPCTKVI